MGTLKITTSHNVEIEYKIAGFDDRALAWLIDEIIASCYIVAVVIALYFAYANLIDSNQTILIFLAVAAFVPVIGYHVLSEIFMDGQSIGKKLRNIKVASVNGKEPTVGQYILRWIFRVVDFALCNGLIAIIVFFAGKKGQRVGDIVAGTTVIKIQPLEKADTVFFAPTEVNYTPLYPQVATISEDDMTKIRNAYYEAKRIHNQLAIAALAEKIKTLINVQPRQTPGKFIETAIKDYLHLSQNEDL